MSTISQSACTNRRTPGWALGMLLLAAALSLLAPHRLAQEASGLLSLITADEVEAVSFVDKGQQLQARAPRQPSKAIK